MDILVDFYKDSTLVKGGGFTLGDVEPPPTSDRGDFGA